MLFLTLFETIRVIIPSTLLRMFFMRRSGLATKGGIGEGSHAQNFEPPPSVACLPTKNSSPFPSCLTSSLI